MPLDKNQIFNLYGEGSELGTNDPCSLDAYDWCRFNYSKKLELSASKELIVVASFKHPNGVATRYLRFEFCQIYLKKRANMPLCHQKKLKSLDVLRGLEFLLENKYALDDEWFALGIAREK